LYSQVVGYYIYEKTIPVYIFIFRSAVCFSCFSTSCTF